MFTTSMAHERCAKGVEPFLPQASDNHQLLRIPDEKWRILWQKLTKLYLS